MSNVGAEMTNIRQHVRALVIASEAELFVMFVVMASTPPDRSLPFNRLR
jgi:hypothetical protein